MSLNRKNNPDYELRPNASGRGRSWHRVVEKNKNSSTPTSDVSAVSGDFSSSPSSPQPPHDMSMRLENYCDEFEWMDNKEILTEMADEWIDYQEKKHGGETAQYVAIQGKNMGWMNRSGWKIVDIDEFSEEPYGSISVNTGWGQNWDMTNGTLTASQSHHDSPVGNEKYSFHTIHATDIDELEEATGYRIDEDGVEEVLYADAVDGTVDLEEYFATRDD